MTATNGRPEHAGEVGLAHRRRPAGGLDHRAALGDLPRAQAVEEQRPGQPVLEAAGRVGRLVLQVELDPPLRRQRVDQQVGVGAAPGVGLDRRDGAVDPGPAGGVGTVDVGRARDRCGGHPRMITHPRVTSCGQTHPRVARGPRGRAPLGTRAPTARSEAGWSSWVMTNLTAPDRRTQKATPVRHRQGAGARGGSGRPRRYAPSLRRRPRARAAPRAPAGRRGARSPPCRGELAAVGAGEVDPHLDAVGEGDEHARRGAGERAGDHPAAHRRGRR